MQGQEARRYLPPTAQIAACSTRPGNGLKAIELKNRNDPEREKVERREAEVETKKSTSTFRRQVATDVKPL